MQFTIRLDWQKWQRDQRAHAMFAQLPFGMDIPITLMLDNWWLLQEKGFNEAHESIIDGLDEYRIEDSIGDTLFGDGNYNPQELYQRYVEPYHDLVVEIVYDLFQQSHGQLLPLFNSQYNIGQFAVTLVQMFPSAVIVEFAQQIPTISDHQVMTNNVPVATPLRHVPANPIVNWHLTPDAANQAERLTEMIQPPLTSYL